MTQPADMAVVTCHFNPCNYRSRDNNLLRCISAIANEGIPLYLAYLGFNNNELAIPLASSSVLRLRAQDILWHKERLLNILIRSLPTKYTKVAWIDADVVFTDPRWFQWASELLDTYSLIQLFDKVEQRDNEGKPIREQIGLAAYKSSGKPDPFKMDTSRTWPGLAWAARRELLATHGLFDVMIAGGADTYMTMAAYGPVGNKWWKWHADLLAPKLRKAWSDWADPFCQDVQSRVGYVPARIVQLGHGTISNRRYVNRLRILVSNDFDPGSDIAPDKSGLWQWATHKPLLHDAVREYFESRKEDVFDDEATTDYGLR